MVKSSMKKKANMVALIAVLMLPLFSQASDFGNWLIFFGNKKIDQKWNVHNEVQYRNYNVIGDFDTF